MADIERLLKERASALAPTPSQRQAAARSHAYLRDLLSTGNMDYRIQNDYLSGSYARQTAIRPLDDVDVVFEIDASRWNRGLIARVFDRLPAPGAVLETFARAIRRRYPNSSVRKQRRSVGLIMEHLHIDVVPAVVDEQREQWLKIPDAKDGKWIVTAPRIHSENAIKINESCEGRFKPMVRLLKGWNAGLPSTAQFKSFAVETLAARLFSSVELESLTEGAYSFFDFVTWRGGKVAAMTWRDKLSIDLGRWTGALPDLAGSGSNLVANCDAARRERFTEAARVARDAFASAASARTQESAWRHVDRRLRAGMPRL